MIVKVEYLLEPGTGSNTRVRSWIEMSEDEYADFRRRIDAAGPGAGAAAIREEAERRFPRCHPKNRQFCSAEL